MVAAIEYEIKRQIEALEKGEKLSQETRGWNEEKKCTYVQRSKEEAHDYRYFPEPDLPELKLKHLEEEIKNSIKGRLPEEKIENLAVKYGVSLPTVSTMVRGGTALLFEETMKTDPSLDAVGTANYILNRKIDPSTSPQQIVKDIKAKSSGIISDVGELEKVAEDVTAENPGIVETYKKGKLTSIQALIGAVMKKTQGKADPTKVKEILEKLLS